MLPYARKEFCKRLFTLIKVKAGPLAKLKQTKEAAFHPYLRL